MSLDRVSASAFVPQNAIPLPGPQAPPPPPPPPPPLIPLPPFQQLINQPAGG